jgi:hypothetical protein
MTDVPRVLFVCTGNSAPSQEDPARATGTHAEVLEVFRRSRDEIEQLVKQFLGTINQIPGGSILKLTYAFPIDTIVGKHNTYR